MKKGTLNIILYIIVLQLFTLNAFSQGSKFYIADPEIQSKKDTIIYDQKTSSFYDSLKVKAYQNRLTRELHNIIIVPPKKTNNELSGSERIVLDYLPYNGKIINKIDFIRLNPFGTDLWDTSYNNVNTITKFGNTIHIKTQERVLQQHLIVRPGDVFNSYTVADNERLLRELKYIEDVRILVIQDSLQTDHVNLVIITKDIWSKAFFLDLKEIDEGKLGLWDRNIFGMGNDFENNIYWNPNKSDFWGYDAIYKSRNILGTFINSSIFYKNIFETHSYGLSIDRKFFTPSTMYAGGLSMQKTETIESIWYSDTLQIKEPINYSNIDFWLGRSILINPENAGINKRINLILASRLVKNQFTARPPETSENLFYEYHNNTIWLNSISLTAQSFFRSNLIYSFGRTEDIPTGWILNFTLGKEFSEYPDRYYTSVKAAHGNFLANLGYLYSSVSAGTFIKQGGELQQSVTEIKLNYFTNLFVFGRYKFRHFININHTRGSHRFALERININDSNGIRGLSNSHIYGEQKFTLNMESVLFSPSTIYGFRFSLFGFADFALIGGQYQKFGELASYNGYGFGIRIRNERLVFPTFQFRFAFYPGIDDINAADYFNFSGEKKLNPENFSSGVPQIIRY